AGIDTVVKETLKDAYQQALKLLSENRRALDEIAAFLIDRETITGAEFMDIFHRIDREEHPERYPADTQQLTDDAQAADPDSADAARDADAGQAAADGASDAGQLAADGACDAAQADGQGADQNPLPDADQAAADGACDADQTDADPARGAEPVQNDYADIENNPAGAADDAVSIMDAADRYTLSWEKKDHE
ncbi:MAG: hypothetical protein II627_07660, partial [Lachnospiraceae bacterium]|nr:hypothetical protein [Lachnospiraceae bacterium]